MRDYVTARRARHLYSVTVQASVEAFDRVLVVFEDYLAGWRWDRYRLT